MHVRQHDKIVSGETSWHRKQSW